MSSTDLFDIPTKAIRKRRQTKTTIESDTTKVTVTVVKSQIEARKKRGLELFNKGNVQKVEENLYIVLSASNESTVYTVENGKCDCPDFEKRGNLYLCKHIHAVNYSKFKSAAVVVS